MIYRERLARGAIEGWTKTARRGAIADARRKGVRRS